MIVLVDQIGDRNQSLFLVSVFSAAFSKVAKGWGHWGGVTGMCIQNYYALQVWLSQITTFGRTWYCFQCTVYVNKMSPYSNNNYFGSTVSIV